jgi:hypothetical protein
MIPTAGTIHCLRILREPDEEVTPGHRHHQALGGCLPESANVLLDTDDPDECNTVYNAVRTRGSSSCSATSSAYARLRACRHTVQAELPTTGAPCLRCCSVDPSEGHARRLLWG